MTKSSIQNYRFEKFLYKDGIEANKKERIGTKRRNQSYKETSEKRGGGDIHLPGNAAAGGKERR